MSTFVNVGAKETLPDTDIPTKAALKRLLAANPRDVVLYTTSGFDESKQLYGNELVVGVKYQVTGPNPYTSRKWYATVEKKENGTITVK